MVQQLSDSDMLDVQKSGIDENMNNGVQQGYVSNHPDDFGANFGAAYGNAASADAVHNTLPSGKEASGLGATLGSVAGTATRDLAGATVGAAAGAPVAGVGAIPGAIMGAGAAEGGAAVARDMRAHVQAGQNPLAPQALPGYVVEGAGPIALSAIPVAGGAGSLIRNAAYQGVGMAGLSAVNDVAHGRPVNVQQAATSGAVGAALPTLGAAGSKLFQTFLQGKLGFAGLESPEQAAAMLPEKSGAAPAEAGGQPSSAQLPPLGVQQHPIQQQIAQEAQDFANYRHTLGQNGIAPVQAAQLYFTKENPTSILKTLGLDPNQTADAWLQAYKSNANQNFLTGYQPNASQGMQGTMQQVQQQQGQNVQRGLNTIQQYQPQEIQTPNADAFPRGGRTAQISGNVQSGISVLDAINDAIQSGNELDLEGVEQWLHAQGIQNHTIQELIQRERALNQDFSGIGNIETPNADNITQQNQQALIQATRNSLGLAQSIKGQQAGQQTAQQQALIQAAQGGLDLAGSMQGQRTAQQQAAMEQLNKLLHGDFSGIGNIETPQATKAQLETQALKNRSIDRLIQGYSGNVTGAAGTAKPPKNYHPAVNPPPGPGKTPQRHSPTG